MTKAGPEPGGLRSGVAVKAFISGCAGTRLTSEEADFFAAEQPFGFILFKRNCRDPDEVGELIRNFRHAVGSADAPVLIDQEGGRVQRLAPPRWPAYAPAEAIGRVHAAARPDGLRAASLQGRLIAADLTALGIDIDCAPVLDVSAAGASGVIGDRAFGEKPQVVATLGRALANGLMDGGILPVIKHIPGHGRAPRDSHATLPVVDTDLDTLAASDFVPFAELSDLPMAMTAHVAYTAVDGHRPATHSPTVIRDIIRGRISFQGLLISDDVSMNALSGDYPTRAAAIYDAGCDVVLHCNGRTEEMRAVAGAAPKLAGLSGERASRALQQRRQPAPFDYQAGREEYDALLARVGWRPKSV